MPPPELPADSSNTFKDRKTGLVVFGFFTVLMGVVCALFVPLMLFGQAMSQQAGAPQSVQMILPAVMMYGLLAVALVWLGIGSMKARRWARALILIFSWTWLVIGVVSVGVSAFTLPIIMAQMPATAAGQGQAPLPPSASLFMVVFPMVILGVIFIILPSIWVSFYRSKHVKATCEAHDPVVRWTDRCPLPVIAVSIWMAFSSLSLVLMAFLAKGVMPFFGVFVSGPAGSAFYLVLAILWGYCAWALYKLDRRGWWTVAITVCLFAVSAFVTYLRRDISELYRLMGYPEQQIAQIEKFGFFNGQAAAWISLFAAVPLLGYLIYLRRFFPASTAAE